MAEAKFSQNSAFREHGTGKSRLMCFSNFGSNPEYHMFLAETGDQNTTGISFIDFKTRATRDVVKHDDEGTHYTAHIAISKQPSETGGHLVLAERVLGIFLGSIKDHFAWLSKDAALIKPFTDESGLVRTARSVFEIDGHQSTTIRDALKNGTLQDIEFVEAIKEPDGLDEDEVVKGVIHRATWEVK